MDRPMMRGARRYALWLAAAVLLLALTGERVSADKLPIMLSEEDWSLAGPYASSQSSFLIPDYWRVRQATLSLEYTVTELARRDRSSVTLMMNGAPFHSFRPAVDGQSRQRLEVMVPRELLRPGSNLFTVQGDIRTRPVEAICEDEGNRDNWLRFYHTASIGIDYDRQPVDGTIRGFAKRFGGLEALAGMESAVVVPDAAKPAELEAAAYAIAGLAKAAMLKDKPVELLQLSEGQWLAKPLSVVIALRGQLPGELSSQLESRDWSKEAVLQLMEQSGRLVLVVTGEEPELLVKAGRLLGNPELVEQLDRRTAVVSAETAVDTPQVVMNRAMALTENGELITGARHQERSYYIPLPANRTLAEASKIRLDFRYARNLDFDRSMVTIRVGNKPIGSKRLSEELADGDSLTLPIPSNLNVRGNFAVTAAFDLELEGDYCLPPVEEMPWVYIDSTSMLQLNTKDNTELLFNHYPYPFLRDGLFHRIAVALPRERTAELYASIGHIFSLLGQYAEGNSGEIKFLDDDSPSDSWKDRNIIAIGSFRDNALIRQNNDKLHFRYDGEGRYFHSNEKRSLDAQYGSALGSLQLLPSPYEAGHALLAVTGPDDERIRQVSLLLATEKERGKVWGDAVLADRDGLVSPYRFQLPAEAAPERALASVLSRSDAVPFLVSAGLVIALVLLSLLLMARKYRRKRGGSGEA
ncbi:cellulose biosynthesis cyclic di-GMP-binding regulatory protein BcsB [Paenibacillus sp. PL2-23]|uniref:cellulose biosynthesis cyclic di-GMP-binding regulatory protein BcsB n=1 Tax=Paenibacillus sp. PL2-23 TaxID=2100729 RepID=UPI0030FA5D40